MCPGANPDPVLGLPIDKIVTAFCAWPCMVRNFIGRHAGIPHDPGGGCIHVSCQTIIGNQTFTTPGAGEEMGAGLDRQLIERHMVKTQIKRL